MCKIHIIITSQSTKVGNNPFPGLNSIIMKCPTLPLGKREGNLQMGTGEITRLESSRTLGALNIGEIDKNA